jgi:hypothetical protein
VHPQWEVERANRQQDTGWAARLRRMREDASDRFKLPRPPTLRNPIKDWFDDGGFRGKRLTTKVTGDSPSEVTYLSAHSSSEREGVRRQGLTQAHAQRPGAPAPAAALAWVRRGPARAQKAFSSAQ